MKFDDMVVMVEVLVPMCSRVSWNNCYCSSCWCYFPAGDYNSILHDRRRNCLALVTRGVRFIGAFKFPHEVAFQIKDFFYIVTKL